MTISEELIEKLAKTLNDRHNRYFFNKAHAEVTALPPNFTADNDYQICERERIIRNRNSYTEIILPQGLEFEWQIDFVDLQDDAPEDLLNNFNSIIRHNTKLNTEWNAYKKQQQQKFVMNWLKDNDFCINVDD